MTHEQAFADRISGYELLCILVMRLAFIVGQIVGWVQIAKGGQERVFVGCTLIVARLLAAIISSLIGLRATVRTLRD